MKNTVRRGRPRKEVKVVIPKLEKLNDIKFDDKLFVPMKTGTKLDKMFSGEGGLMKATNYAFVGDPGVGKSTVMLDVLSDLQNKGAKVLFISGEMTSIDLYGYKKRYPKFGNVDILFMGNYVDYDPIQVIEQTLEEGFDVVLIDSMAEVCTSVVDYHGGTFKKAESMILNILERHNKAENEAKLHTSFLIIQQVTKSGTFAGSNRFKHMLTGMGHIKFVESGRCIFFSKNRRGGEMNRLFFSLEQKNDVAYLYTEPMMGEDK